MTGITRDELMQMMIRHGFKRAPVIWHHMSVDQDGVIALVNDVLERAAVECEEFGFSEDRPRDYGVRIRALKINIGD